LGVRRNRDFQRFRRFQGKYFPVRGANFFGCFLQAQGNVFFFPGNSVLVPLAPFVVLLPQVAENLFPF